jgi:hypothetical protein
MNKFFLAWSFVPGLNHKDLCIGLNFSYFGSPAELLHNFTFCSDIPRSIKVGRYPGRRGTNPATRGGGGGRKETLEEEVLEATVDGEGLKETLSEEV